MNDELVIADLQSHLESEIEDYLCYRGRNWSPEAWNSMMLRRMNPRKAVSDG